VGFRFPVQGAGSAVLHGEVLETLNIKTMNPKFLSAIPRILLPLHPDHLSPYTPNTVNLEL